MKQYLLLTLSLLTCAPLLAQVPDVMNSVKYVVIDPSYGEEDTLDPYGLVSQVSATMLSSGYKVLMGDQSNWPAELKKNPCLATYATIETVPRMIGKYQVIFDFEDCNGVLMYRAKGGGSGNSPADAFQDGGSWALRKLKDFQLDFQEDKAKKSKKSKRLQYEKEELDTMINAAVNPSIIGLYRVEEGEGDFTVAVIPMEDVWQVVVYEAGNYRAEEGEVLGILKKADISGVYNMIWHKFTGEKTLAKWDKEKLEISQPAGAGQAAPLVLLRYIPED
ncbi:hypothetical protein AB9P05_09480 [Roseivirga sp. BDSF3-8]|uniref:hypothetical protein n=1 Tax=Roseivirga sp. BDSF3-8 TaxID=3241598 RepID=UPI00353236CF